MMKKHLFTAFLSVYSLSAFSADLIGTWDIRNYNSSGYGIAFGMLGEANSIQFKKNGTFFCNDSVSGTYVLKGDDLVLNRDQKHLKAFKKKYKDATEADKKDFLCDSLKISFTKEGNKALSELTQDKYGVWKDNVVGLIFELTKKGTNGKNEDLNEGKCVVGRWRTSFDDKTVIFDLAANGVGVVEVSSELEDNSMMSPCYYKINGKHIRLTCPDMGQIFNSEFIIGKNSIFILTDGNDEGAVVKLIKLPEEVETHSENKKAKTVTSYEVADYSQNGVKKGNLISVITCNGKDKVLEYYSPYNEESAKLTAKYDEQGNRIEEYEFDNEGNLLKMKFTKFNEYNKRVKELVVTNEDGELNYSSLFVAEYNDEGLLIEERLLSSEGILFQRNTHKYDKYGNETEYCIYQSDGILEEKTTNVYDKKGNLVLQNYTSEESSGKVTYKYDVNGKMVEECHFNSNGKLSQKTTYTYDQKRFLKKNTTIQNGAKTEIQYKHNDDGLLLESYTYYPSQTTPVKEINKYDANKKIIESCIYGTDGKLRKKTTYTRSKDKEEVLIIELEDGVFKTGELTVYEYFK